MNDLELYSFRHNSWATRRLIEFCRPLPTEQLTTPGTGTYGGVLATLDHIIRCDGSYARRMAAPAVSGVEIAHADLTWVDHGPSADFDELDRWAAEVGMVWEEVLARPVDPERVIVVDDGEHEVRAGIFFAQAINHANHHREQVCSILTGFGIEPPDIQAWEYAWHTGLIWDHAG